MAKSKLEIELRLDITAKVLQQKRDILEDAIAKLLVEFEKETLLTVDSVYLKRHPGMIGQGTADISGVNIEVLL